MFRSTSSFGLFDYFRVPYDLEGSPDAVDGRLERLASAEGGATLFWPSAAAIEAGSLTPDIYRLGSVPIAGRVLAAETMRALAAGLTGTWHEAEPLHDEGGAPVSAVWRSSEGG